MTAILGLVSRLHRLFGSSVCVCVSFLVQPTLKVGTKKGNQQEKRVPFCGSPCFKTHPAASRKCGKGFKEFTSVRKSKLFEVHR